MVTSKRPRRTITYRDAESARVAENAVLSRLSARGGGNVNDEYEAVLLDGLLTTNERVRWYMWDVYLHLGDRGHNALQEAVASVLDLGCNGNLGPGGSGGAGRDLTPVVRLAQRQSHRANTWIDLDDPLMTHFADCWGRVCAVLERERERLGDDIALMDGATLDRRIRLGDLANEARHVLQWAERGPKDRPDAAAYFDMVMMRGAWEVIGDYGMTYRALHDAVLLAEDWPYNPATVEEFKGVLVALFAEEG